MRVPERWLRSMVNPNADTQALADMLTMAGLEVEEVGALAPEFSGVVVARVLETAKHPDADRLRVCKVDIGAGSDPLQIVCGAPNVVPEMIVACATEGAVLPGGFKIKRAKMRGVESQGMLCSAKELGIAEDAEGLIALPQVLSKKLGANVRDALGLDAQVLTLKLTPNRADCLSIAGVAREVSALTGAQLCLPHWPKIESKMTDRQAFRISAPDLCGRFSGRLIRGVNAKSATPDWMRERLEQAGQRSISALVDISNYVMLELGRPSHVFDADRIQGELDIRWAKDGESVALLNEQAVKLDASVGVIADRTGPLSLAGIMGGASTAVSLETKNVFVEAAFWWPDAIRGRARRFNFTTDAGHRFERGVDWTLTADHVDYITHLILMICGGEPGPMDDKQTQVPKREPVGMRVSRCNRILGIKVSSDECMAIFSRLGFAAGISKGADGGDLITVTPPAARFDIEIEEDLIEEVARVYGYERIPTHPPVAPMVMSLAKESSRSAMQIRDRLVAADYFEAITYSFIDERAARTFSSDEPLALLNPMASHQSVMRPSIIPGLLDVLATNVSRKQSRVRLFEIGRTFHPSPKTGSADWSVAGIHQPLRLAGLAYGPAFDDQWGESDRSADFFDVKADLAMVVQPLDMSTQRMGGADGSAENAAFSGFLHPGRSAQILVAGKPVGLIGELHPALVQKLELPLAPVVFELALDALIQLPMPQISDVPRFPVVLRDLALVVPVETPAGELIRMVKKRKSQSKQWSWIQDVKCFDEYRGKGLSEKEKSLAFRFILQSPEVTLQDSEVDALMAEILGVIQKEFSARLRG